LPFADVAAGIRAELARRRRTAALDAWVERARDDADIEVLP
jgi:hypothetical protein